MSALTLRARMLQHATPEQVLVVAMLCQALSDARHPPFTSPSAAVYGSRQMRENAAFCDARAWLLTERDAVQEWLDLLNLPRGTYAWLLKAAGLEEVTPCRPGIAMR